MSALALQRVPVASPADDLGPVPDEALAARCNARLLITGAADAATTLVRRIHDASARSDRACLKVRVPDLPPTAATFAEAWTQLLEQAPGGTLLVSDIELMAEPVQCRLIALLDDLRNARDGFDVRVVTTTARSLRDLVTATRFSEQLFYRLNTIHLVLPVTPGASCPPGTAEP